MGGPGREKFEPRFGHAKIKNEIRAGEFKERVELRPNANHGRLNHLCDIVATWSTVGELPHRGDTSVAGRQAEFSGACAAHCRWQTESFGNLGLALSKGHRGS